MSKEVVPMLEYTKDELDNTLEERLNELVAFAGGYVHLAKMLSVPTSTTQGWVNRGRISKAGAVKVAKNNRFKGEFSTSYLRPDL
jgi:hypothetical protein